MTAHVKLPTQTGARLVPIGEGVRLCLPPEYRPTQEHMALHVPPGWIELQAYLPPHWFRVNHEHRLAIGDVEKKYEKLRALRQHRPGYQVSPPPKGFFDIEADGRVVLVVSDGSHRYSGALLLAVRPILARFNWPLSELDRLTMGEPASRSR